MLVTETHRQLACVPFQLGPAYPGPFTYQISDPGVVAVLPGGRAYGLSAGTATVVVLKDGKPYQKHVVHIDGLAAAEKPLPAVSGMKVKRAGSTQLLIEWKQQRRAKAYLVLHKVSPDPLLPHATVLADALAEPQPQDAAGCTDGQPESMAGGNPVLEGASLAAEGQVAETEAAETDAWEILALVDADTLSFTHEGLQPNSVHTYQVRALSRSTAVAPKKNQPRLYAYGVGRFGYAAYARAYTKSAKKINAGKIHVNRSHVLALVGHRSRNLGGQAVVKTPGKKPLSAKVAYTSSDPGVALVEQGTGIVTGVAPGTAKVRVRMHNGTTKSIPVTVKETLDQTDIHFIAHRGALDLAPENTMAAFREALRVGYDCIEADVQETADGSLIIFHDATTGRLCEHDVPVRSLTYATLADHPLIRGAHVEAFPGQCIPTLEEFLQFVAESGLKLQLELKLSDGVPFTAAGLAAIRSALRNSGIENRTTITSFSADTVCAVGDWDLPRGLITKAAPSGLEEVMRFARENGLQMLCSKYYKKDPIGLEQVQLAASFGLELDMWILTSLAKAAYLSDIGVQHITCNRKLWGVE